MRCPGGPVTRSSPRSGGGVGSRHLLPRPGPRQAYLQQNVPGAERPRPAGDDPLAGRVLAIPVTRRSSEAVLAHDGGGASATSRRGPAHGNPLTPPGTRPGTRGPGRAGRPRVDGPEPPPGHRGAPEPDLAAVADPVSEVLEAAATARPAPPASPSRSAWSRRPISTPLVIAAPTTAHLPLALAAIGRGIAVLVEKPLAPTVDEALEIVAAARRSRRPGPGRPRRALQPRGPRAGPAPPRRAGSRPSSPSSAPGRARSRPGSGTSA